jgi:hypothetical protein
MRVQRTDREMILPVVTQSLYREKSSVVIRLMLS